MGKIDVINERLRALPVAQAVTGGDSAFTEADRQLIDEVYQQLFGKSVRKCSCKNRYSDALMEILSTLKISRNMKEQKYRLKAGPVIWLDNDCYNRHNLTDEVAKEYLKLHPDAVNLFEAIPEPEPEKAEEAPKAEETKKKTKKTKE